MGQRITGMTSGQSSFPVAQSIFKFSQHGKSGTWLSELLPHTAKIVDDIAIVKSTNTEAINHDPAITFIQTGSQQPGRPSIGSWVSYGLGSENQNLPAFVVLISQASGISTDQPLFSRLWGSGFLPSQLPGRAASAPAGDPVLYLSNPPGIDAGSAPADARRPGELNQMQRRGVGDPEIDDAHRPVRDGVPDADVSVPELTDLSKEPDSVFELYGPDARKPGTFAANCLLARRLAERGVRFIQLYHTRLGPAQQPARADLALQCTRRRPALRRAGAGSEAARAARRHAGDLGRRVRPHASTARAS